MLAWGILQGLLEEDLFDFGELLWDGILRFRLEVVGNWGMLKMGVLQGFFRSEFSVLE